MDIPDVTTLIVTKERLPRNEKYALQIAFNNLILHALLGIIYKQFKVKALGGVDTNGDSWAPTTEALTLWKKKTKQPIVKINGKVGINVRYGQLLGSLEPGLIVNYKYIPTALQRVHITTTNIHFALQAPHADEVNDIRPFFPSDMGHWLDQAIKKVLPEIKRLSKQRIK